MVRLEKLKERPFITTNLCAEIVQCIKQNTSGIRATLGTTLSNMQGEVIYTPPAGEAVIREKMANLERSINGECVLDPLIKMTLMHYQLEAIHPFIDGNGRTGRILLLLYLNMERLLNVPALYLNEYIIQNKAFYYQKVRAVTEDGDWEGWILYMLDMIEKTATSGLKKLKEIIAVMEANSEEIRDKFPKVHP